MQRQEPGRMHGTELSTELNIRECNVLHGLTDASESLMAGCWHTPWAKQTPRCLAICWPVARLMMGGIALLQTKCCSAVNCDCHVTALIQQGELCGLHRHLRSEAV